MRNRLWIAAAVAVAAASWLTVRGLLASHDGSTGFTLTTAKGGWVLTLLALALASLPALGAGLIASTAGHRLAGVFVASMSLLFLAGAGGSMDGWLRAIPGPGSYGLLVLEILFWQAGLMALLWVIHRFNGPLGERWRWLRGKDERHAQDMDLLWGSPDGLSWMAGGIALVVGGVASFFLIRSAESGQVIGGLLVGFTMGAAAARAALPQVKHCLPTLLAPGVAAVLVYLYVWMGYASHDELLAARFAQTALDAGLTNRLPSLALALPIHYASAALAGCTLGLGLGNAINAGRHDAATAVETA